jgi:hypothetical protein
MSASGSPNANLAVETLAADMGLTVIALKILLEDAHDLLEVHRASTPNLAFHMALARHGYKIDGQVLLAKLSTFRGLFSVVLSDATGMADLRYNFMSMLMIQLLQQLLRPQPRECDRTHTEHWRIARLVELCYHCSTLPTRCRGKSTTKIRELCPHCDQRHRPATLAVATKARRL